MALPMSRLDMGGYRIQETKIPVTELYRPGLHPDQRHPVSSPLCLLFLLDTHIVWGIKLKIKVFIQHSIVDTVLGPEDMEMNKLGKNSVSMKFHSSVGGEGVTENQTHNVQTT